MDSINVYLQCISYTGLGVLAKLGGCLFPAVDLDTLNEKNIKDTSNNSYLISTLYHT